MSCRPLKVRIGTKPTTILKVQYDRWHEYRKGALFFLDTQEVNDADSTFAKTLMYIKAKDVSNGSGELLALKEQLKFLHENEKNQLCKHFIKFLHNCIY